MKDNLSDGSFYWVDNQIKTVAGGKCSTFSEKQFLRRPELHKSNVIHLSLLQVITNISSLRHAKYSTQHLYVYIMLCTDTIS